MNKSELIGRSTKPAKGVSKIAAAAKSVATKKAAKPAKKASAKAAASASTGATPKALKFKVGKLMK